MGVQELSRRLLHYKRKDIQEAIVQNAKAREVGIRYSDKGFGKRPDILEFPNDILQLVKNGATSFHISEERWSSPLQLTPMMRKRDLDNLRTGWDLVIDIDCPYWFFSKLTTHLFIKALKKHGIKSISCKFSGNKGFHIGVPFEAFPERVGNILFKDWFPEGPRRIALYMLDYISAKFVQQESDQIIFDNQYKYSFSQLAKETNVDINKLTYESRCKKCHKAREDLHKTQYEYLCPQCDTRVIAGNKMKVPLCEKCKSIMNEFAHVKTKCENCGSSEFEEIFQFNPFSVVEFDTLLITSRHMYRSVYSLNEKSGLVSIPIDIGGVMEFEKTHAKPELIDVNNAPVFLDNTTAAPDEGKLLVIQAFDFASRSKPIAKTKTKRDYDDLLEGKQLPAELFPPCINNILKGLEDGRKRSLFILLNFLTSAGWDYNKIGELLEKWNQKNFEPLRETLIKTHINYHKQKNQKILPPNCRSFYQDLRVCAPDPLCDRIRNPVNYSRRKAFSLNRGKRAKLTDEQREMRKKFRENLKKKL